VVAEKQPVSEQARTDPDLKTAILTANGVEEHVKVIHRPARSVQPWRFSVDLPRALLVTVMTGVGYLLYVVPHVPAVMRACADNPLACWLL
jgi:copper transporter 1